MGRLRLVPVGSYRLGLDVDAGLLASGWSLPELAHVWSDGPRAVLRIPVSDALAHGGYVELRINPFVVDGRHGRQRVTGRVGRRVVGRATLHMPSVLWWRLPAGVAPDGVLQLRLDIPDAVRACDVLDCADIRELGLGLTSARIFGFQPAEQRAEEEAAPALPEPEDTRALLMAFDSLGDNCEFGLVQRRAGAEPLGLFRFAGTSIAVASEIIEADFRGVADTDNLLIEPKQLPSGDYEWLIRHRLYEFWYHTMVTTVSVSEQQIRKREGARLTLAVRRMRDVLQTGERLLVVKRNIGLTEGEVMRLSAAVRAHGLTTILWVRQGSAAATPRAEYLCEGIMRGVMPRLAPYENAGDADDAAWHALCRSAWDLWRGRRALSSLPAWLMEAAD